MKNVKRIISILLVTGLFILLPQNGQMVSVHAAQAAVVAPLSQIPVLNPEWMEKKITLVIQEQNWECNMTDLATMPVKVMSQGAGFSYEIADPGLLKAWIEIINTSLLNSRTTGTEAVFDRTTGAMKMADPGYALQIRYEFLPFLQQGIQMQLTAGQPQDMVINMGEGFLVSVPADGQMVMASACTTTLKGSSSNRITNITVGASRMNQYILMPGETMSVSDVLLPRTPQNGYKLAGVYQDGETVAGYGGGICQLSSTFYNAAMNSGLKVTERHPHSMTVSYLKAGLDAAISSGSKDLKVMNPYDLPVIIVAGVESNKLTIGVMLNQSLLGGKTYKLWSEIPRTNSANTYLSTYIGDQETDRVYIGRSNYMPHQ